MAESKSQRKRKAYNYRAEYFKRNPGLCGCIWFCSQCGLPLFGRRNVQVDHIVPLASIGINRTINTVAICPKCNSAKSDNGGIYIVKGIVAKILEVVAFSIQKVLLFALVGIITLLHSIKNLIIYVVGIPFRDTSLTTQLVAVVIYCFILAWIISAIL